MPGFFVNQFLDLHQQKDLHKDLELARVGKVVNSIPQGDLVDVDCEFIHEHGGKLGSCQWSWAPVSINGHIIASCLKAFCC